MKAVIAQLRKFRERLGVREDAIAAIVLAVFGAAGLLYTVITHIGTPAGTALAYMAAVDRADTDYVWSHSTFEPIDASAAETKLLNRSDLAAQLGATAHSRSAYSIQSVGYVSTGTKITLTYDMAQGRRTSSLVLLGGAPHLWSVLLYPAGLDLTVPTGAGTVAVDGLPLNLIPGRHRLEVFPGLHKLTLAASDLYASSEQLVEAEPTLPTFTRATFASILLTEKATTDARETVTNALRSCAGAIDLKPANCPQSYTSDITNSAVHWTLLGDPVSSVTIGIDAGGELAVTGHYLMKLNYQPVSGRERTIAVGGPYIASVSWDGQAFAVSSFGEAAPTPALPRSAASDGQVLSALQAQFASCLKLQAGSAPQCPQSVLLVDASNVVWTANGDPTQGASVAWDGTQGFFRVAGNFDFTVDYNSTPQYGPTRHYQDHSSGQYTADIYWDGAKAAFVGFEK